MEQKIITVQDHYKGIDLWVKELRIKSILLVCDDSIEFQKKLLSKLDGLKSAEVRIIRFSGFQPNPSYESVTEGVMVFRNESCDAIIAVGGGSAMDVAKCIKLYSNMEGNGENGGYLQQNIIPNKVPFLAIPTTAGTGSEATRYAVIYYKGIKQSVTDYSCIPGTVLLDPGTLKTLSLYQKKATMLDALCHSIESYWSVNSTEESRAYSRKAIEMIMTNMSGYLSNQDDANANMLLAANKAGKAINISQTTAGHAMCYKITSLYRCAHGHAAALCDRILFPWMIENVSKCIDPRGETFLKGILDEIGQAMGCRDAKTGSIIFQDLFQKLNLEIPEASEEEIDILVSSVNPVRLGNHPILLTNESIRSLYSEILKTREKHES